MNILAGVLAFLGLGGAPAPAVAAQTPPAPQTYTVKVTQIADQKAVFATVESANVVPARARIAGTIAELTVKDGDHVEQGQVIAIVGDPKLVLQVNSASAQISAAQAQLAQAKVEWDRAQRLLKAGAISRSAYDQARTTYNVAANNVKSLTAQRSVIQQQETEGQILSPTAGRVITVPVTTGTVLMSGDTVATIAEQDFMLRLKVPERHARYLKLGDTIRLDGAEVGLSGPRFGKITLIYPQIENGQVTADATVEELKDYFVGERVRVWVSAGSRAAIVVPSNLITTQSGIDYARVLLKSGTAISVPVQRGREMPTPAMANGLEILSGLHAGDRLLRP